MARPAASFVFVGLGCAALAWLQPGRALAGACCASATASGVGRLRPWEDLAVGLFETASMAVGYWDTDGSWRDYEGYAEVGLRSELWGLVRLNERTSGFARLPWLWTERRTSNLTARGEGPGDAQLGGRYEVLHLGEDERLPALALSGVVVVPTGRAMDEAEGPLGEDVTGRGAWVLGVGLSAEKTKLPWFFRVDLEGTAPLPRERADTHETQRYGLGGSATLLGGLELIPDVLVATAFVRYGTEGALTAEDELVDDSERAETAVGSTLSVHLSPAWSLLGALDAGLPFNGFGAGQPARLAATLGLRYGYF